MSIRTAILGILLSLLAMGGVEVVRAAESTSFQMDAQFGDRLGAARDSSAFRIDHESVTWRESALESDSFALMSPEVGEGEVISSSSSSSSSFSSAQSSAEPSPGDEGGGSGSHGSQSSGGEFVFEPEFSSSSRGSQSSRGGLFFGPEFGSSSRMSIGWPAPRPAAGEASEDEESSAHSVPVYEVSATPRLQVDHAAASSAPVRVTFLENLPEGCESFRFSVLALFVLALGVFYLQLHRGQRRKRGKKELPSRDRIFWAVFVSVYVAAALLILLYPCAASAATTAPLTHVYNGRLLTSAGEPVTTVHSIRFSYWTSADLAAGDIAGDGSLNASAATYGGWQEVHAVTPDARGNFSVVLGGTTPLPSFDALPTSALLSLALQVEVKVQAAADTAYEVLDPRPADSSIDRSSVLSVPFARNADLLDQRDVGTGSGTIPLLRDGGVLSPDAIPSGVSLDTFAIDFDDSSPDDVTLAFGGSLGNTLTYEIDDDRFRFNDDVRIEGNLTVTGLINGVDVTQLTPDAQLIASPDAGLAIHVAEGNYGINGEITAFTGADAVPVPDDATSFVFFTATGLLVSEIGFPTDRSYIPVAMVTAAGGDVQSVADRRVLYSDDREASIEQAFHPEYADAAYLGDGSDNVGQLSVMHEDASGRNAYVWTSSRDALQDYTVVVRYRLPSTFARWAADPVSVSYRTSSADAALANVSIEILDTAGQTVTLDEPAAGLASAAWTSSTFHFGGTPAWTAGQDILLKITVAAKGAEQAFLGDLVLRFVELN